MRKVGEDAAEDLRAKGTRRRLAGASVACATLSLACIAVLWLLSLTQRAWSTPGGRFSLTRIVSYHASPSLRARYPGARIKPYRMVRWGPPAVAFMYFAGVLAVVSFVCTAIAAFLYRRQTSDEKRMNTVALSFVLVSILLLLLLYFGVKARAVLFMTEWRAAAPPRS